MNDFGLSEQSLKAIVDEIAAYSEVDKAVIFGSRAIGTNKIGSDVDIALYGKDLSFALVSDIQAALNERTLQPYYFDLLNYGAIESAELKNHIDTFGKVIYTK